MSEANPVPESSGSQTPALDFLKPRFAELVRQAEAQGIAHDVVVAVLTDLVTSDAYNDAAPDPLADSAPPPASDVVDDRAALIATAKNNLVEQVVEPRTII